MRIPVVGEQLERAETWFYTGPAGRVAAFVGDFSAAWIRWARGLDPSVRPERHAPTDDSRPSD